MVDAWQRIVARGDAWYWIAVHARFGDLFQICALAAPFRAHHGAKYPIKLVVSYTVYLPIVALFGDLIDEVIVAPEFPNSVEGWRELADAMSFADFGPNVPLKLQPNIDPAAGQLRNFANAYGISWMKIYKSILRLPDAVQPELPPRHADTIAAAERWCADHQVVRGRTAILFPYAQSFPVDCSHHFAALAAALAADGYEVLTSISREERPIDGTRGVFIPFPILIEVASYAGWAIIIRSGIADILATADCRKTVIYMDVENLRVWSLRALELCRDAEEISVDFGAIAAADFIDAVVQPADLSAVVPRPGGLSAMVEANLYGDVAVERAHFPALHRSEARMVRSLDASRRMIGSGGVAVFRDVPRRDDPYLAGAATGLAQRLVPLLQHGAHAYATTDAEHPTGIETLAPNALLTGAYAAADRAHTILLSATPLPASLPPAVARLIAPIRQTIVNETIPISVATLDAGTIVGSVTSPQSFGGLQILSGWCGAEEWGVWSLGLKSRIRVAFVNDTPGEARLILVYNPILSAAFPEFSFEVDVDGRRQQRVQARYGEHVPELIVPLVPAAGPGLQSHLITLRFDAVFTPREHGVSEDGRQLGIGLRFARLDLPAAAPPPAPAGGA